MRDMRAVNWSFKKCLDNVDGMIAPCMDPVFIGIQDDAAICREVGILRDAGFNTLMIEGLRRLMLYEHRGISAEIRGAIKHVVQIAHAAGLRVFYHSTCTLVDQTLDGLSPAELSMLSIDGATGRPAHIECWNGWYLWCLNNPDFKRIYYSLAKKLVEETGVDGMMTDEVYFRSGWSDCVCPHCLKKFGGELPEVDFDDPEWTRWLRFRLGSIGDFYAGLREAIGGIPLMGCKNDEPNPSHSQLFAENNDERMRGTSILFTEICDRKLKENWQKAVSNCAAYQGLGNRWNTPVAVFGISNTSDIEFTYALRMAHAGRPWVGGSALMQRSLSPKDNLSDVPADVLEWKRLFEWENRYWELFRRSTIPAASVALLLSASTRDQYNCENSEFGKSLVTYLGKKSPKIRNPTGGESDFVEEYSGWNKALTTAHIQFAVITEAQLNEKDLAPFQALIIPNSVCLPEIDLRGFKGKLIVTGESGTRDAFGQRRRVPLFAARRLLNEFAVEELLSLPMPVRVLAAPPSLLIRAMFAEDGMLVHIVNCGGSVNAPVLLEADNGTAATLFSPDFPEEIPLEIADGKITVAPASINIYSVVHIRTGKTDLRL